jgi:hypothetical protein
MIDLYINNIRVPLSDGERIIMKKAPAKMGDLSTRSGDFTNDFQVKASAELNEVFGFASNLQTQSSVPQTKQDAELKISGQYSVARGFIQLAEYNEITNTYTLTFYAGLIPWVSLIGDAKLRDIYLSDLDHVWDAAAITGSFNNTEGYIYPWINYGRLDNISGIVADPMFVTDWYPAVFQKTLIYRIFEAIGYKVGGSFVNDWQYQNAIIPFAAPKFTDGEGVIYAPGDTVTLAPTLPEISQIDFIRDMVMRHGVIISTDEATRTINFDTFDWIIKRTSSATDWSDKVDLSRIRRVDYRETLQNYAQSNYFKYQPVTENDSFLVTWEQTTRRSFADESLNITNDFLPKSTDMYQSVFQPTYQDFAFVDATYTVDPWVLLPYIPIKTPLGVNEYDPGPRILYLIGNLPISEFGYYNSTNKYNLTDASSTVATIGTSAPYAYFAKPTIYGKLDAGAKTASTIVNEINDQLAFSDVPYNERFPAVWTEPDFGEGLLTKWYSRLRTILNTPRYIEISVYLRAYEYFNFDFTMPIYLNSGKIQGYFYVDSLEFDGQSPAKVGLIQII